MTDAEFWSQCAREELEFAKAEDCMVSLYYPDLGPEMRAAVVAVCRAYKDQLYGLWWER